MPVWNRPIFDERLMWIPGGFGRPNEGQKVPFDNWAKIDLKPKKSGRLAPRYEQYSPFINNASHPGFDQLFVRPNITKLALDLSG